MMTTQNKPSAPAGPAPQVPPNWEIREGGRPVKAKSPAPELLREHQSAARPPGTPPQVPPNRVIREGSKPTVADPARDRIRETR